MLSTQANLFFGRLANKQFELSKLEKELSQSILKNVGATTVFSDLRTQTFGLKEIINSTATSFGVTPEDLVSHRFKWKNELKKRKSTNGLDRPETSAAEILVDHICEKDL